MLSSKMVTNLAAMMFERLTLFRSRNRRLPDRVLVYRDGVSEARHSHFSVDHTIELFVRVNS